MVLIHWQPGLVSTLGQKATLQKPGPIGYIRPRKKKKKIFSEGPGQQVKKVFHGADLKVPELGHCLLSAYGHVQRSLLHLNQCSLVKLDPYFSPSQMHLTL